MLKFLSTIFIYLTLILPVKSEILELGRLATKSEVASWDIDVRPDGVGLPTGSGSVEYGEEVFSEKCASCHGDFGEAVDRWPILAGGQNTLMDDRPVKTMGSYWPYLSTVWDYIHRAMPFGNAQSLTNDEVYGMVAYLLYLNDVVDDDFILSKENFANIELENAEGFFIDDRPQTEYSLFSKTPCMKNCKKEVKITARARVIDVTPEETKEQKAKEAVMETATLNKTSEGDLNLEHGKKVFKKCKACHRIGPQAKNGVGPSLNGIFGIKVASNPSFKYSKAFKKASENGLVWDDDTLYSFLENPKSYIKKTKMAYKGLKKEKDLTAVISYIKSFE